MSAGVSACRLALFALLMFGVMAAEAGAATLYVAPGGAGTACSQQAPCGSLNQAYRTASPGDTVQIAAGSYSGQTVAKDTAKPLGSATVVFRAAGAVTMSGFTTLANDVEYLGISVPHNQVTVRAGRNVVLRDFNAEKPYIWGPTSSTSTGDTLQNVTIKGGDFGPHVSCGGGFQITRDGPPRNITIDGATFHDFTIDSSCPTAHLDCLHSFNGIQGLTIKNSRFYRCQHFGMLINSATDVTIENNFIEGGIYGFKLRGDNDPSIEVFNNVTLRNNSADHISLSTPGSNTLNNVRVEGNATTDRINCRTGVTYSKNLGQNGGPCSGDLPNATIGFANPSVGDFHIPPSSPAVDRLTTGPGADYDGQARPQGSGYDVGADEVTQTGSSPPPPPPPPPSTPETNPPPTLSPLPPAPLPALSVGDETNPPGGTTSAFRPPNWAKGMQSDSSTLSLRRVPGTLSVSRRGRVALPLTCVPHGAAGRAPRCVGIVVLRASTHAAAKARRGGVLGRAPFRVRAGRAKVVRLHLSPRWRRVRRGRRTQMVSVRASTSDGDEVGKRVALVGRRGRRS